jgi:hypothetical protein
VARKRSAACKAPRIKVIVQGLVVKCGCDEAPVFRVLREGVSLKEPVPFRDRLSVVVEGCIPGAFMEGPSSRTSHTGDRAQK